jgi:uncharacterized repeat protein (TIGR02543 family)
MKRIILSAVVLIVIVSALAWVTTANTARHATLISDKADYHPGETVKLTGTGWQPGEKVAIVMVVDPLTHGAITLNAVADDAGKLTNSLYVVQRSDINVTFTVIARGDKGSIARTTFTDHEYITSVTITPTGAGTVTSTGTGTNISCPSTCAGDWSGGNAVTITATANSGYFFSGWSTTGVAVCSGSTNPCSFTAATGTNDTTLTATFVSNNKRKGQTIVGQLESIKGEVAPRGL